MPAFASSPATDRKVFLYTVSGLLVRCDLELAAATATAASGRTEDIVIAAHPLPEHLDDAQRYSSALESRPGELLLHISGVGRFLIRGGREILYDVVPGIRMRGVALYLMGSCFGALLQQRGSLVLHGSAVSVNRHAVVFCGPSGAGKSTMAAMLCQAGYPLLNDDVCNLVLSEGAYCVQPDSRKLKLWSRSLDELLWPAESATAVTDDLDKYFCVPPLAETEPRPVLAIYMLQEACLGDPASIHRLPVLEATMALRRNAHRPFLISAMGMDETYFEASALLQRKAGIFRLRRQKDFAASETVQTMLEAHWKTLLEPATIGR